MRDLVIEVMAARLYRVRRTIAAAHARFGIHGEIIRRYEIDVHDDGKLLLDSGDDLRLPFDRCAFGHQHISIGQRPAGILHVRNLESFRTY